ncbi:MULTISPECIES: outer membrane protein assembly factor BamE [Enterobacterales]|uniref:outer membrane protein assembly factor BamE n=1 Tax=Enterobacterales TaxID=91347 RepID=UPI002ED9BDA6
MTIKLVFAAAAAPLLLSLLSACSLSHPDNEGKAAKPVFPAPQNASFKGGSYVDIVALEKISAGMNKAQIQQLIGHPHFSEGMVNVREWDYLFNFPRTDQQPLQCQYKVLFDKKMVARSFYFKPENCLQQLPPPVTIDSCRVNSEKECLRLLQIDRAFIK